MAEQSADPLRNLTEKLFCPKCKGAFKNPKQLPCFHSVCLPCLEPFPNTNGQHVITCPRCQQESRLGEETAVDLPNSPYIASLFEVAQILSRKLSVMKCASCSEVPTLLQGDYCVQCDRFLCENCVTDHNAFNVDHRLVPLEDIQDAQSRFFKPCTFCQIEHHEEKEVELFCAECQIAICSLCSVTKHNSHRQEVLKTTASEHKSQMENLIDEQLKEAKKKMDEVRRIDEECKEVCNQEAEVENDVNNFFKAIHDCLEEKKKNMLAAMRDQAVTSRAQLKRKKTLIQNQEEVTRFAMEAAAALLTHTTSVEVINLKKSLDMIVTEVKEEERAHCDPERRPLQTNFVKAQEVLDILKAKGIGFLKLQSDTSAHQSHAEGNGIEEATAGLRAEFTLTTRNSGGKPYYNKRDRITVEAKDKYGQDAVPGVHIEHIEDGTYKISYFFKKAGELQASVKVNGEDIPGCPFPVKVKTRQFEEELTFGKTFGEGSERWGLAVSDDDEIAMTISSRNVVQLFKSDLVTMLSFTKRDNREKEFNSPTGITFDKNGNILVADGFNGVIHTFSPKLESREYEYKGRKIGGIREPEHQINSPSGLSIDKNGNIIVADTEDKLVKILTPEGNFVKEIGSRFESGERSFVYPCHCVQVNKYFVVSDTFAHVIKVFDQEGTFLYQFGNKGDGDKGLDHPRCLAVDKVGHLLVCDHGNNRIQVFELEESSLTLIGAIGNGGNSKVELKQPFSVGVLSDGRIIVNDVGNKRLLKIA